MSLQIGSRLGPYEITAAAGQGGMGEVYRARDTKLNRDVAIKILPAIFASDSERLARFEREAQALAALNHPNIAQIHGVIDLPAPGGSPAPGAGALVMEFVEGEDLSQRIAGGPIPIDEALPIARQIAEAIEAAHERGIIHRDLKPANVKVRSDGMVKVLDFGLAKGSSADPMAPPISAAIENSPTFTSPVRAHGLSTQMGVILGTAAYMAPEQARGKTIDRRVDIWAFGCILYEMLAGKRPFAGETVTDLMSAVVSREPDWGALPPPIPGPIARLLKRCLEKDARRRLRDIGEARLVLEDPQSIPQDAVAPDVTGAPTPRWLVAALAGVAVILAVTTSLLLIGNRRTDGKGTGQRLMRFDVQPPDNASLSVVFRPAIALPPGGDVLAFAAIAEGVNRIYVRSLSRGDAYAVPGSEGGMNPELSPDGRWVAFFANGTVKKAPIDGHATTLAAGRDVRGIAWTDDGSLILTADPASPLVRMSDQGGEMRQVTRLASGERTHRWPDVLPGGKAVVFTVGTLTSPDNYDEATIEAVVLDSGARREILKGAAMARYCGGGRLIYSKGPGLFAVPFDPVRLTTTGRPVQVVQAVARDASTGAAHFDCSVDGTLAYMPGATAGDLHRLVWADMKGILKQANLAPGRHQEVRISPDGTRAALLDGTSGTGDVWIHEFDTGTFNRLTFNTTNAAPMWSPDGRSVYYTSFDRNGTRSSIVRKLADGSREAEVLATVESRAYVAWVDRDERSAVIDTVDPASDRGDIVRARFESSEGPEPLVATPSNEFASSVSPGGKWLAYQADETGRPEIYVRELTGAALRRQVTVAGGEEPHWSGDGRTLFYRTSNRLMSVPIDERPAFRAGNPRVVLDGIYNTGIESGRSYDVDPRTTRFLLVRPADAGQSARAVRVVLNWDQEAGSPGRRE